LYHFGFGQAKFTCIQILSFAGMITVSQALKIVDREVTPLGNERVDIADAVGRVLAEDIVADHDLPPFDRSQMDGYAVRAADTANAPVILKLAGESAAGRGWRGTLKKGEAVRIMTGAPVPKGANAVQKLELASESEGLVTLAEPTEKSRYIVKRGSETKKGRVVMRKGEVISAANIAIPAAFGFSKIRVSRRPRVAIIATGSEIVDISKKPKADQIRNSNSAMLSALCRDAGAETTVFPIAGDDISQLKRCISDASRQHDIVVMTGGVSVGKYDLTKAALSEIGAEIFFEKLRLKPGKPAVFAKLKNTCIFGLPGNPVSASVTFYLFVRRAILLMQSAIHVDLLRGAAITKSIIKGTKGRDFYSPVTLAAERGVLVATPIKWHGSSDLVGFASADALAVVPAGRSIEAEKPVEILFLPHFGK
jgi:molybdenum cofactor synthesis domain-containing protein